MSDNEEVRITLRLPHWLRDEIAEGAEKNSRSMNGEIVKRLMDASATFEELERAFAYSKGAYDEVLLIIFNYIEEIAETGEKPEPGFATALRRAVVKSLPEELFSMPMLSVPPAPVESLDGIKDFVVRRSK